MKGFDFVVKVSPEKLPDNGSLEVSVEKDFAPATIATCLKAAHLTLFSILGYRYVNSTDGLFLGNILRRSFEEFAGKPRKAAQCEFEQYFQRQSNIVIPLAKTVGPIRCDGTIADRKMICCIGSSGKAFATGVLVKIKESLHLVILPVGNADAVSTWHSFTQSSGPKQCKGTLMEFCRDDDGHPFWKVSPDDTIQMHWPEA